MSTRILAIETSCDETALALVEADGGQKRPRFKILAETVSSQIPVHRPFGGVVPMLAKREHLKNLPVVLEKLKKSLTPEPHALNPDLIAVTVGPGLEPALWTGVNFAKELAKKLKKRLVGVNHLEGHIYSNWLEPVRKFPISNFQFPKFPAVVLIVSGGHTILLLMKSMTKWKKLGETRDDAAGEAFDKTAKMLGLPYPGGPELEKLALNLSKEEILIPFPRPMIHQKNYDVSFAGLKTAVLYYLRDLMTGQRRPAGLALSQKLKVAVAASFQQAAIDVLVAKTSRAAQEFRAKSILLCGGVACNKALQKELKSASRRIKAEFFAPRKKFNTDNAAMIAAAAYLNPKKYRIEARPNLNL